jgi:uncharacterized protein YbbC (DUF1343 family)
MVEVVPCESWRGQEFDRCGQAWIQPSPNLRSLHQAFLYPGVALLEFCNVSVGRGTDTPFQVIGAPWIDGRRLALHLSEREVPGVRFLARSFTPAASRFAGAGCEGVEILVVDRARLRPLLLGLELITALRFLYPEEFDLEACAKLLCSASTLAALREGRSPREIERGWQAGEARFEERRAAALLYDRASIR